MKPENRQILEDIVNQLATEPLAADDYMFCGNSDLQASQLYAALIDVLADIRKYEHKQMVADYDVHYQAAVKLTELENKLAEIESAVRTLRRLASNEPLIDWLWYVGEAGIRITVQSVLCKTNEIRKLLDILQ
jgi:hypothetical protein